MLSFWAYILIGNDRTGKTSFQKYLVEELCGVKRQTLHSNLIFDIVHPRMPRGFETLSTISRSYQEKVKEYQSVERFFERFFKEASICILSSHTHGNAIAEVRSMIKELKHRCYNVGGVFFSNGFDADARMISQLNWDERFWIENPIVKQKEQIDVQISRQAREFIHMLIARSSIQ